MRTPVPKRACLALLATAGLGTIGCATWDNPAALSDIQPTVEYTLSPSDLGTFTAIDLEVAVQALSGDRVMMDDAMLELTDPVGGVRTMAMARDGEHYGGIMVFLEPGTYHARIMGTPMGHALRAEMGEFEMEVHPLHGAVGSWTVQVSLEAPTTVPSERHLILTVEDAAGTPVPGLSLAGEWHQPDGTDAEITFEDLGDGRYEAELRLLAWGDYELHLDINGVTGQLHLRIPAPDASGEAGDPPGGGHGH
ncbi:MAG: hypothetical protein WD934_04720 [Gemmatimonadales bacterium]